MIPVGNPHKQWPDAPSEYQRGAWHTYWASFQIGKSSLQGCARLSMCLARSDINAACEMALAKILFRVMQTDRTQQECRNRRAPSR